MNKLEIGKLDRKHSADELENIDKKLEAICLICGDCITLKGCDGCILSRVASEAWEARKALEKHVKDWITEMDEESRESMGRKEILEAATRCVCGDREQDYGTPERNFELIGELWTTYLKAKCVSPEADGCISGEDVATMMCLFKIARIATGRGKADSFIDLAGYAACAGELAMGGGAE